MTDAHSTATPDGFSAPRPMLEGSAARTLQQVSIEAERLSGTMRDGVEAAQAASTTYGGLFMDTYAGMVRGSVSNGVAFSDHVLALLQARTAADAFRLNVEFMQRQVSSAQDRLFALAGVEADRSRVGRDG